VLLSSPITSDFLTRRSISRKNSKELSNVFDALYEYATKSQALNSVPGVNYVPYGETYFDTLTDKRYYVLPTTGEIDDTFNDLPVDEVGLKYNSTGPRSYLIGKSVGFAATVFRVQADLVDIEDVTDKLVEFMDSIKAEHEEANLEFNYIIVLGVDFEETVQRPFRYSGRAFVHPCEVPDEVLSVDVSPRTIGSHGIAAPIYAGVQHNCANLNQAQNPTGEISTGVHVAPSCDESPDQEILSEHSWDETPELSPSVTETDSSAEEETPVVRFSIGINRLLEDYKKTLEYSSPKLSFGNFTEMEKQVPSGYPALSIIEHGIPAPKKEVVESVSACATENGEDLRILKPQTPYPLKRSGLSPQEVAKYYSDLKRKEVYIWGLRDRNNACNARNPGKQERDRRKPRLCLKC